MERSFVDENINLTIIFCWGNSKAKGTDKIDYIIKLGNSKTCYYEIVCISNYIRFL